MATHLLDDVGIVRRTLNQLHFEAQGVLFEGFAIVGADIDINANDFARRLAGIKAFHNIVEVEQRC